MSSIPIVDFEPPFDVTGYTQITAAQIQQLVGGLGPMTNIGFFVVTYDDNSGNPAVPNPAAESKWTAYGWLRVGNSASGGVSLYIWNPNIASQAPLLQWQLANITSIAAGTITGSQIAALTITDANIFSVGWSKLPSGGAVGGALVGSMPSPSLANGSVGNSNLANLSVSGWVAGPTLSNIMANTINDGNIQLQGISFLSILLGTIHGVDNAGNGSQLALNTVGLTNILGSNVANQLQITDSVTPTNMDWLTVAKVLIGSTELDTNLSTTKFMPVIVNSAGTGYTTKAHDILQVYTEANSTNFPSTTPTCAGGVTPKLTATANVVVATNFGTSGTIAFTPLSAASKVLVECDINCGNTTLADYITVGLFQGSSLLTYNQFTTTPYGRNARLTALLTPGSTSTIDFSIAIAPSAGSAQINIDSGNQISSIKITEYL